MMLSTLSSYTGRREYGVVCRIVRISDQSSSISMATISTRAVMASEALTSEKSSAACSSSERSSSMTSSSSAVSKMLCSSCEAASSSSSGCSPFRGSVRSFTSPTTSSTTGASTIIMMRTAYAKRSDMRLAFFLARIFGIVSPKIMTVMVRITVASHDQRSFPASVNASTEASDDAPMFTR